MKIIKLTLLSLLIINLYACEIVPEREIADSEQEAIDYEQTTERTLILGGKQFKESKPGEFSSWKCSHYSNAGKTLVEVGRMPSNYVKKLSGDDKNSDDFIKIVGFVLYDGTDSGDFTMYERRGLNQRWDWDANGSYSFIINPDGTGRFYDFSSAKEGEKIKANEVFKCNK